PPFGHLFHHAMGGKEDMRAIADKKIARDRDPGRLQRFDLGQEGLWIDDQPVADDGLFTRPQNTAGDELQNELLLPNEHGMPGVVAALITRDDVKAAGEQIDDLPLALISPLGAQYDYVSHSKPNHFSVFVLPRAGQGVFSIPAIYRAGDSTPCTS